MAHGASVDHNLEQDVAATRSWRAAMPDLRVTIGRIVEEWSVVDIATLLKQLS